MASFGFDSGRQFETDPISGQIFFREPIQEELYSPWRALEPSDYHMPPPAPHNVGILPSISPPCCVLTSDFSLSRRPLRPVVLMTFVTNSWSFSTKIRALTPQVVWFPRWATNHSQTCVISHKPLQDLRGSLFGQNVVPTPNLFWGYV